MVWSNPVKDAVAETYCVSNFDVKDTTEEAVDYDNNVTQLFTCLENSRWGEAIDLCTTDPSQASVWVCRYEQISNTVRWQMLPLHAAIIFKANNQVIEAIISAYPEAVKMTDDQGMLPVS